MCGIFGCTRSITDRQVNEIKRLLDHRGPDSWGHECIHDGEVTLNFIHTRLAIQDLSTSGHQPMVSKNGRWSITFNGEIYNHFSLRKELECGFQGTSDTETLIEYISTFGIDKTVQNLNGLFAFAVFDRQEKTVTLVRDQFGIKPVYYTIENGGFGFSSEVKPLLYLHDKKELDLAGLGSFLSLRYIPSTSTLFSGISRLAPGHYLKYDLETGDHFTHHYVQPTQDRFQGSFDDAVEQYQVELSRAVESQLISDVPVGVLLSGGIDSAVVAAMAREKSKSLTSFTVGFGSQHEDCEIQDAAETAKVLSIPHESVIVTPTDLQNSLGDIFNCVEEPLGTTSIMPMWYLSKLARTKSTVVLTGQGNDEPWGGYRRYQIELLLTKMPWLKSSLLRIPSSISSMASGDGMRRGLRCLGIANTRDRFAEAYALFTREQIHAMCGNEMNAELSEVDYWLNWLKPVSHITDDERMMRIDTRMNLADDLLLYGDKVSMAFALETRVPMLDVGLIGFIESLPLAYRTSLRKTKIAHREMARRYLPATIINRKKKGFQVPFSDWSRGIWKDFVSGHLLDENQKIHQYIKRSELENIWQQHLKKSPDSSRQIFALLMLSGWCESFL